MGAALEVEKVRLRNSVPLMARLPRLNNLLWFDSGAAALSAITSLLAGGWMARWFDLPRGLLTLLAAISLTYALYSGSLAWGRSRSRLLLAILVIANAAYVVWCGLLIAHFWRPANGVGLGYLGLEAGFVATLVAVECQVLRREWSQLN